MGADLYRPDGPTGILAYAFSLFLEFDDDFDFFLEREPGQLSAPGALLPEYPVCSFIFHRIGSRMA